MSDNSDPINIRVNQYSPLIPPPMDQYPEPPNLPLNIPDHAKEATLREVQAILHQSILDRGNEAIGEIRWMKDEIVKEVVREVMKELIAELNRRDDIILKATAIAAAIKDRQP